VNDKAKKTQALLSGSLWTLVLMVFMMVIIGGITRLTGSGLSMVEWEPITGILPPLTQEQWIAEFARYQTSPEFLKVHSDMILSQFKSIFWLEYIHRLWGRALALVLLIPTYICVSKPKYSFVRLRIVTLWILGASQGFLGWYMVKSGLVNDPMVSPYRLAAHLLLGFTIFAIALSSVFALKPPPTTLGYSNRDLRKVQIAGILGLGFLGLTVTMGAFVAGLKAGLVYNTFPKMGATWFPAEIFYNNPFWTNFTENPAMVQLTHRILATLSVGYLLYFAISNHKRRIPHQLLTALLIMASLIVLQYLLGILTLLYQVPVSLGTIHQACALLVFGVLIYILSYTNRMQKG
jgi:cytochrome c oxidase assembly protein subunit 15